LKKEENLVVIISSFMSDEPIGAIVSAAGMLPELQFAFTGDSKRLGWNTCELPPNVRLTGYLAERAFWKLLSQAALVCDLTLKPDCLVCGAYEALALGKPMVLSDNQATREIFGTAAILAGGEAEDIVRAVRTAIEQREQLEDHARRLREGYGAPWRAQAAVIWDSIRAGATAPRRGVV
jgi:glycosyltransferase involved in cell wall biosynthesis